MQNGIWKVPLISLFIILRVTHDTKHLRKYLSSSCGFFYYRFGFFRRLTSVSPRFEYLLSLRDQIVTTRTWIVLRMQGPRLVYSSAYGHIFRFLCLFEDQSTVRNSF